MMSTEEFLEALENNFESHSAPSEVSQPSQVMSPSAQVTAYAAQSSNENPAAETKDKHEKNLTLQPLNTDKKGTYRIWRFRAKASILGHMAGTSMGHFYLQIVDSESYDDTKLKQTIIASPVLSKLDIQVYSAILNCIQGMQIQPILNRFEANVEQGHGCLAIRNLDRFFQHDTEKQRSICSMELINLTPRSHSPRDMDSFLSRFRVLKHTAKNDVGKSILTEVLFRAFAPIPPLAIEWAAWKRNSIEEDIDELIHNADQIISDAVCRGGWSKAVQYSQYGAIAHEYQEYHENHDLQAYAANKQHEETRTCLNCGEKGHIRPNCPKPRKAKGQPKGNDMAHFAQMIADAVVKGLGSKNGSAGGH